MGLVSLFFSSAGARTTFKRAVADKDPVVIAVDAKLSESLEADAEITDHPVERRPDISDHIVVKPKVLTLEVLVSETPISFGGVVAGAATALAGTLGQKALGSLGAFGGAIGGGFVGKSVAGLLGLADSETRLSDFITELSNTHKAKRPVEIQTGIRKYPSGDDGDFYLKSWTVKHDKEKGRAIGVTVVFREVFTVESRTTVVRFPKKVRGAGKQKVGRNGANPVPDSKQRGASVALQLVRGLGNLVGVGQ